MSVDAYIVQHANYKVAFDLIKSCHDAFKAGRKPKNLRLVGVSGVGKTTLLKAYRDLYLPHAGEDRTVIPVLYVPLPSRPSESAMYGEFLFALGDPFPYSGTVTERRHRIIEFFKKCHVELLILDEIQHFLDRGKLKTHIAHADSLKSLIDAIDCSVILAGAPRSGELFKINTQLRSRFKSITAFLPFSTFTQESTHSFKKLMKAMLKNSVFENINFFDENESLQRFFYATDGILRNISDLLSIAEDIAKKENSNVLSMWILNASFKSWIGVASRFAKGVNPSPFLESFEKRRLTLPGELYEPSDLDGDNHGWKDGLNE
ncbi:TniB family NTP-binding protein [Undibacterium sp. TS12]|uniref:TniB family NTP-binding protein n=1 Tax=Undibacterium sp. TS12 TaxID=2908202 RepID=UPI001F4D1997|nr:TniB family NTP-binding protein [Undibacterium sp. TS12]MCH8618148.1 TniB family NTP-binding protein [Undibacterium sp. TS12]